MSWINTKKLTSKNYICGYCGSNICSNIGYFNDDDEMSIYICHKCNKPTFFQWEEIQTPGSLFGKQFEVAIPEIVSNLYNEARLDYSVNAFSSVGMCCRKLLMHIAVELGAKEGLKFIEYIDFLDKENYISKNSKKWVDVIRKMGNLTTHEIIILNQKEAELLITFSSIIINLIYENELLLDGENNGV